MEALRVLAFLAFAAAVSGSQTSDCSYVSLLKHLQLTSANTNLSVIRPVKHWTTSTVVLIDMLIYSILQVDEKLQTITSHISVHMNWKNEFLTWNSSDFCGINLLTIPISLLWIPDINIQEDASDTSSIHKSSLASLTNNGSVYTSAYQLLTSTCKLNLKLFPFDKQMCNFSFGSMTSPEHIISVRAFHNDTTITMLSKQSTVTHGEWSLRNLDIKLYNRNKSGVQDRLVYTITLVRKPLLYVINFIVPLFYLLTLDLASFFISEARGEKLSFKITILLSISVLLLILQDILPSTEEQLPMIAIYCVAVFALVGISVLEAMVVSFLCDLDGNRDQKVKKGANTTVEMQLEVDIRKEHEEKGPVQPEKCSLHQDWPSGLELLKKILQEVKAARKEMNKEADKTKPGYYRKVAQIIDRVFFVLYSLTVVVFLMSMYILWFQYQFVY